MEQQIYVRRSIEVALAKLVDSFPAVAVVGARQTGKSTLLREAFPAYRYVTFDDPMVAQRATDDPKLFLESVGDRAIFDEIQHVPALTSYLKVRIDADRGRNGRFILTGSQQFAMMKGLGDSLAGRVALLELPCFSVAELRSSGEPFVSMGAREMFVRSCLRGCYPQPALDSKLPAPQWYGAYVRTYLERDVRGLHNIGGLHDFQRFMQLLAARCAQTLNMSAIAAGCGVAVNTVKSWLSVLEAGHVVTLLQPYWPNLGKRVIKSPKVYFGDCGLVCHLAGIADEQYVMQGPLAGPLFENYCVMETLKVFAAHGQRAPVYFVRTSNQLEVDLLIEHAYQDVTPVEVKLTASPRTEMAAPVRQLRGIFAGLRMRDAHLVCLADLPGTLSPDMRIDTVDSYLEWLGSQAPQ